MAIQLSDSARSTQIIEPDFFEATPPGSPLVGSVDRSNDLTAGNNTARSSDYAQRLRACAQALHRYRRAVIEALIAGTTYGRENRFNDSPEQLKERIGENLALLTKHLGGQEDFGSLYTGHRIFELTQLERPSEENRADYRRAVTEERDVYVALLKPHVSPEALDSFRTEFRALTAGLMAQPQCRVRALFIGDCLLHEILAFAVGPLMDAGISIDPYAINPRDPADLERILNNLATKTFDVVLINPFSHTRLPEIFRLLDPRLAFARRRQIDALVA